MNSATEDSVIEKNGWRFFQGKDTGQSPHWNEEDGFDAKKSDDAWYYEPADYDGDVIWSLPFATLEAAEAAATEEGLDADDDEEVEDASDDEVVEVSKPLPEEPVGRVRWEDGVDFVMSVYGDEGDQPGDCVAQWGVDDEGYWWASHGDDAVVERAGPFLTKEEAEAAAKKIAADLDDGNGLTAEELYEKRVSDARARKRSSGKFAIVWINEDGTFELDDRYDDSADAELIIDDWYKKTLKGAPRAMTYLMRHPVLANWPLRERGVTVSTSFLPREAIPPCVRGTKAWEK